MKFFDSSTRYVHWLLRLSLAATFLYHGWSKFPVDVAAPEIGSALLLIAGGFGKDVLTRLGALGMIVILIGAIFIVHLPNGWNAMTGGMEFQVLMVAVGVYFLVKGNTA
jgi:putative oxidoreductase